jgi:hypothetical protein
MTLVPRLLLKLQHKLNVTGSKLYVFLLITLHICLGRTLVLESLTLSQNQKLNRRSNALSYRRVREWITSKMQYCSHAKGCYSPSDILLDAWLGKFWYLIHPLILWKAERRLIGANDKAPLPFLVKDIKSNLEDIFSGFRVVTDDNQISNYTSRDVNLSLLCIP